jgi:hypothetical protein
MKSKSVTSESSPTTHFRNKGFAGLTKRLLTTVAALALGAWSVSVTQAANVLFNPNLDQVGFTTQINPCPLGWIVVANKSVSGTFSDGGDSETFCNQSPPSDPAGYGFFFKPFQGDVSSEDLLTVNLYQDNSSTPNTGYTLSGYAAAQQNFCAFFDTNVPPADLLLYVAFLDNAGNLITSNAYDLVANGLPNLGSGATPLSQFTTPQYTAPAGTFTVRAGALLVNAYGTSGAQSCFADSFDLEAIAAPGSPIITNQPSQASVAAGGNASFTVGVSNPNGATYQWQLNSVDVSGSEFSGATSPTLTVTGVSTNDIGHYRVLVSNGSGSVYSQDAPLTILNVTINPVITLTGKSGDTYEVDYTTDLNTPTWIPLSTNKLSAATLQVVDPTSALTGKRFYRAVFLY